ncbi:MAG: MFS transporter [Verrucomicrobia subdivision 3 bacterium]|nr:MFS transporter [Limisphaerales bacterium]
MPNTKPTTRNPWAWIPTLYTAEGLPYVLVMTVAVVMYKGLGISNTDIALYTSWLYLPWVIKPLWSPVVDILKTRRWWIWTMQVLIGGGLAGVALTIPAPDFFQWTLACFWLLAFSSATHDIAADGFYLLATTEKEQSFFVGIRSTFYRIASIFGQGLLVILAGFIQSYTGLPKIPIVVEARPETALVQSLPSATLPAAAPTAGELRVMVAPAQIQIAPQPRTKAEIAALLGEAKNWNAKNHFLRSQKRAAATGNKDAGDSWWRRGVSGPLGSFLREHFGQATAARSELAGNLGFVSLQLSRPPGKEVVVTLAFKSGDKSVSLAEGARLVFDDSNWNLPARAVLQLDPKLRSATTARFEVRSGNIPLSWSITFFTLVGFFLLFAAWHQFILPYPDQDQPGDAHGIVTFLTEFFKTFGAFFRRPKIVLLLLFLLLYRFGEAQLVKMVAPFLLDAREVGGIGLTTEQFGLAYGTFGILALTGGGLLGGMVVSKFGLKFWLWPMVLAIHLPDAIFIYLAYAQPDNLAIVSACVAVEQFGYGFGFTAYMLYMIYIARGKHPTAHYAICTGFMALGMMLPGMWSGWLQELIGYQHFFVWVILATLPSFAVVLLIPLDREFGKKNS